MSTLLDSGTLTVWRGANTAPPGGMPVMQYQQVWASCYADKTIGVTRWYTAQQHGDRPDMIVQVERTWDLKVGTDRVILSPYAWQDTGGAYKIVQIQQVTNEENLPRTDLTLERDDGIDAGDITGGAGGSD